MAGSNISAELNISETSLRQNFHKHLGMMPYKVQLVQELKPIDHLMRFRFTKSYFQMKLILTLACSRRGLVSSVSAY